jgi:hypothetical protein
VQHSATPDRPPQESEREPATAAETGDGRGAEAPVSRDAADRDSELRAWKERAHAAERWRDEVWKPMLERAEEARRVQVLERRLAEIESSAWWRVAAPFRAVSRFLRGNWSRLRERE